MHYNMIVTIAGSTHPDDVSRAAFTLVHGFSEQHRVYSTEEGTEPGCGWWDEWTVGGRWHGRFTLKPDAIDRRHRGVLGLPKPAECACGECTISQTDFARLADIEPGSASEPFYWIDLDGRLHSLDDGQNPAHHDVSGIRRSLDSGAALLDYDRLEEINTRRFHEWFRTLPADTWLINVDAHR